VRSNGLLVFDSKTGLIFVSTRGWVNIFHEDSPDRSEASKIKTELGAKTMAYDQSTSLQLVMTNRSMGTRHPILWDIAEFENHDHVFRPGIDSPPKSGGNVGDLLAVAVPRCWREFSHREPRCSYADFF
jgi:hypothetical protein